MVEINFAYTSFKWSNIAKDNAGVSVIIIGLARKNSISEKYIFSGDGAKEIVKKVKNINPYLSDSDNIFIERKSLNINSSFNKMAQGNRPEDNGGLILSENEYKEIISRYPELRNIFKKYIRSHEFINNYYRWVMWFDDDNIEMYKDLPVVRERLNIVKEARLNSPTKTTQKYSEKPHLFVKRGDYNKAVSNFKGNPSEMLNIIIPSVSSENRIYIPMGILSNEDTIISNLAHVIYDSPLYLLGILQSRMHMVWIESVGGKLGTGYRYSNTLVYNTFPIPELSCEDKLEIEDRISYILDVRDEELLSLADLYGSPLATKNPKPMNERLLNAHKSLDRYIDKLYSKKEFSNDEERLSVLLKMYQQKIDEEMKEK